MAQAVAGGRTVTGPLELARNLKRGLAVLESTLRHWGHGRTPTNQQIRSLAQDANDLVADACLLETLVGSKD